LNRDPAGFATDTLNNWVLAADEHGYILSELGNHLIFWRNFLENLRYLRHTDIPPEDFGYRPDSKKSLAELLTLPPRDPMLEPILKEMRPYLMAAVKGLRAGDDCATVEEAVERFPVLKGIRDDELTELRRNRRGLTARNAALELLLERTEVSWGTLDKYFRDPEFRPR
jgi:hypothetical protein